MRFIDAGVLPSTVNVERLPHSSFRNGMLFCCGGGEGKAFKCLKEVVEKPTS